MKKIISLLIATLLEATYHSPLNAAVLPDPNLPAHTFLIETSLVVSGSKKQMQIQSTQQAFVEALQELIKSYLSPERIEKRSAVINQIFYSKADRFIQTFKVISSEIKSAENIYVQKMQVAVDVKWVEELLTKNKLLENSNEGNKKEEPVPAEKDGGSKTALSSSAAKPATNENSSSSDLKNTIPNESSSPAPIEQKIILTDLNSFGEYFEVKKALVKIVGDKNLSEGSFAHRRVSFIYVGNINAGDIFEKLKAQLPQVEKMPVESESTDMAIKYHAPVAVPIPEVSKDL